MEYIERDKLLRQLKNMYEEMVFFDPDRMYREVVSIIKLQPHLNVEVRYEIKEDVDE